MVKLKRKPAKGKGRVRKLYDKLETRVLAAAGRRAVKQKMGSAKRIGKKAARAALAAGAVAAAGVVLREVRGARDPDR